MAELKTKPTQVSVEAFLDGVEPASKREDGKVLDALFRKVTGEAPLMWGPTIVGYGEYHYRYASGHEGDMCRVGFRRARPIIRSTPHAPATARRTRASGWLLR